jgi:hypothetical protein
MGADRPRREGRNAQAAMLLEEDTQWKHARADGLNCLTGASTPLRYGRKSADSSDFRGTRPQLGPCPIAVHSKAS